MLLQSTIQSKMIMEKIFNTQANMGLLKTNT